MELINGFGETSEFVTVVSVGSLDEPINKAQSNQEDLSSGYVTVLTIGDDDDTDADEPCDKIEEVLVYRLPGERLGFGLKFEGGTKASEFVKRLFIQSCAPDSPASRVRSSWGCLTEGDEVLEIDSIPVKSMTRIDCVRCLKDSNVVIKLLVKHSDVRVSAKSTEDLPLVIGAEKKRTPPPPPPVPPRKIPRKGANIVVPPKGFGDTKSQEVRQHNGENGVNGIKNRHQSPRNSARLLQPRQSPEVVKRDRRLSDGSIGPPDAEVYLDLFSQESPYCLSESDDTGSSISTVVDRFGSFPTTTTSSFAGSLPSTPTSTQRKMDLSNVPNPFDDDDCVDNSNALYTKLISLQENGDNMEPPIEKVEMGTPLQPPANFQDAPLSYGDEDVRVVEASIKTAMENDEIITEKPRRPPPPPPRKLKEKNNNDYSAKDEYSENLPRLVDFVPKSTSGEKYETLKKFLENERDLCDCMIKKHDVEEIKENGFGWDEGAEFYTFNWTPSTQLATIGEDEEESFTDNTVQRSQPEQSTPIVIVEETPEEPLVPDVQDKSPEAAVVPVARPSTPPDADVMEAPSINSRQPPDGHEFPDYQEAPIVPKPIMAELPAKPPIRPPHQQQQSNNVRSMIAIFSNGQEGNVPDGEPSDSLNKKGLSKSVMNINTIQSSLTAQPPKTYLEQHTKKPDPPTAAPPRLHTRSQSLIDISDPKLKPETDRWSLLVDQRRTKMSKLKGLIIPEHSEETAASIDLPEIKSTATPLPITEPLPNPPIQTHTRNLSTPSFNLTWNPEPSPTVPKYSPAFKRKSLQILGSNTRKEEATKPSFMDISKPIQKQPTITSQADVDEVETRLPLNDAPKSLESITSPTRSDCSFEYITSSSPEPKKPQPKPNTGKSEDESDNDSAVSSSQSSYISRTSPSTSPNHLHSHFSSESADSLNRRLLKPQSVEAINRKNILASAKCRSGRDLKVGSPLIQRKFDEPEIDTPQVVPTPPATPTTPVTPPTPPTPNGHTVTLRSKKEFDFRSELRRTSVPSREPVERVVPRSMARNSRAASVTDLRKNFEKLTAEGTTPKPPAAVVPVKTSSSRLSLNLSTVTASVPVPAKRNSLPAFVTATPSKPTINVDTKKILEEAVVTLEETIPKDAMKVVVMCPEIPGGSIGITLAGGADYETKDITVHKVRNGSVAFRDGRLQKGDRILAINGKSMKGVTHAESMAILKEPVSEVVLVTCPGKEGATPTTLTPSSRHSSMFDLTSTAPSREIVVSKEKVEYVVTLVKDTAGLGFSMEGGKDSPQGDVPLVIKKLFTGGTADKSGKLKVGDELIEINGTDVTSMPRIDAWTMMKKLPEGNVILRVRR